MTQEEAQLIASTRILTNHKEASVEGGGLVVNVLVSEVQALTGDIVLCSWALSHLILDRIFNSSHNS